MRTRNLYKICDGSSDCHVIGFSEKEVLGSQIVNEYFYDLDEPTAEPLEVTKRDPQDQITVEIGDCKIKLTVKEWLTLDEEYGFKAEIPAILCASDF